MTQKVASIEDNDRKFENLKELADHNKQSYVNDILFLVFGFQWILLNNFQDPFFWVFFIQVHKHLDVKNRSRFENSHNFDEV